ncbi:SET domain-containing protein-lysine N-methyltransferase [Haliangium sp. UPWRP_2]|uniref:SET domain-containing protein n=1 Tax=Haliangium sp. UPWRP_2 TaxID=1931276 RepID=UPI000B53CCA3|nr:SET domain-containing protein-lysine N-methyltransferase [Haliangium sp. UPWRP_2]PSM30628.1 SET domain-containing protein [Haliangium sp. UPWRP_2]
MNTQWLTAKAAARPTENRGDGAFAIAPIGRGETVAVFGGYPVSRAQLEALPEERKRRSIQIDSDLFLVSGEVREPGDMVNHSCEPNCGIRGDIIVVARRDIAVGEELTFDYAMSDASDYDEFRCACGTAVCRGVIRGTDWRDPAIQTRYAGFFTTYVRMCIEGR